MIHDQEDLPRQRTPSLGLGAAAYLNQPTGVENARGRPSVVTSPQTAPPNISVMPPSPHTELSEEAAALLSQKPPPPTPISAPKCDVAKIGYCGLGKYRSGKMATG